MLVSPFLRLICCLALSAIGSVPTSGSVSAPSSNLAFFSSNLPGQVPLSGLPAVVRQYYQGYQYFSKILPDPYASWSPPKPPWKFCENDSYLGNTWRAASLAEFKKLVGQYEKAGLAVGGATVTNSNNNIDLQLSQLNAEVNAGCNVIISIPGSPTGLSSGIAHAFRRHVLFITDESPVYSPYAVNVTFNDYWDAYIGTQAVVKAMGYKGNVIVELGIPGLSDTVGETAAVMRVIHAHPGIHVLGEVDGEWTASIAKTATLEFLATHPERVSGIIDEGQEDVTPEEALQQDGRPLAFENSFSGECATMALWREHPGIMTVGVSQGGAPAMYEAFYVAVRMLYGAKPVVNTLMYPLPEITKANFSRWYNPAEDTLGSTCYTSPPGGYAVPNSYFGSLLKGGTAPSVVPTP